MLTLPRTSATVSLQPPAFDPDAATEFERAVPRIRRALGKLPAVVDVRRDGTYLKLTLSDDGEVADLARQLRSTVATALGSLADRTGLHVGVQRGRHAPGPNYRYAAASEDGGLAETFMLG